MNSALPSDAPTMPSRTIARRALTLPVAYPPGLAGGAAIVGSGSTPGKTYNVVFFVGGPVVCDCIGGQSGHDCSHRWAAAAHADPAVRRALLAIVRPARRMSTAAAERLVERFLVSVLDSSTATLGPEGRFIAAIARRERIAAKIVARLTGRAADDDGEGAS